MCQLAPRRLTPQKCQVSALGFAGDECGSNPASLRRTSRVKSSTGKPGAGRSTVSQRHRPRTSRAGIAWVARNVDTAWVAENLPTWLRGNPGSRVGRDLGPGAARTPWLNWKIGGPANTKLS
jgi:hypothetical protein